MNKTEGITESTKEQITGFIWQHFLLLISLWVMTLGVALSVRSFTGSSVISSIPMEFSLARAEGMVAPLTIGGYTNIMNIIFIIFQILLLRKRFEPVQLFQVIAGFIFGALLDFNMFLTSFLNIDTIWKGILAQLTGCTILAAGISAEVRCGSMTMPGEGIQVAACKVTGLPFPKVKMIIDTLLVTLAVISSYIFWGEWKWDIVGPGPLFAMLYVGYMVKIIGNHIGWFENLLDSRPGFKRVLYGLARFLYPRK